MSDQTPTDRLFSQTGATDATEPLPTKPYPADDVRTDSSSVLSDSPPRPRMRFGALAWGLISVLIALETIMIAGSPNARAGFVAWWQQLGAGGLIVVIVLLSGAFILLQGILALLRRNSHAAPPAE